jgi:uncharacterized protein (TIGR03435 family)
MADGLTIDLGQPVVDQTKVERNFDFKLQFDDVEGKDGPVLGSVFTALREIGLKLEARKIPIEVLIIDTVQKPTEN